ncbi:MAG: hypothetical protein ACOYN4_21140, partial [Bacteroidales bacterium]
MRTYIRSFSTYCLFQKSKLPHLVKYGLIALFISLALLKASFAEGTKQLEPSQNPKLSKQYCKLYFNGDAQRIDFANVGCLEVERLNIYISNPLTEKIYIGMGRFTDYGDSTSNAGGTFKFAVRDPDQLEVPGFTLAAVPTTGTGFISSYPQAIAGPNISGSVPTGYTPLVLTPTKVGNYYIEFMRDGGFTGAPNGYDLRFLDVTVAQGTVPVDGGRLWSKAWQLSSGKVDTDDAMSYAKFFSYSNDSIVTKLDCNGFAGGAFVIYCNSTGTGTSGVWT